MELTDRPTIYYKTESATMCARTRLDLSSSQLIWFVQSDVATIDLFTSVIVSRAFVVPEAFEYL